jgi:hypothetical protein
MQALLTRCSRNQLVGRVTACPERSRMGARRLGSASQRHAEDFPPYPGLPRAPAHLEGEGLGDSRPDSIIVGRIGPNPSMFGPRDPERRDELFCSIGVSVFTGLGGSATVGFGTGALSTSGSRVFVDRDTDRSFDPSAARAPAARISSSVSVAGTDFLSRDLDLCGAGAGDSEVSCSDGCGVCAGGSGFFSRATITSCACTFPMKMTLQSTAGKNRFSMMPHDKRFTPFTSPRS